MIVWLPLLHFIMFLFVYPMQEGAQIKLVGRVNSDWLYGEYGGKKGQFPANFVEHIPRDLPQHKV